MGLCLCLVTEVCMRLSMVCSRGTRPWTASALGMCRGGQVDCGTNLMTWRMYGYLGHGVHNSILHYMGEKFSSEVLYSALSLARQEDFRQDIIECETKSRRFVSMFGVAWGIIPEVDLDSEIFRFIGSSRGWLMAAWKWLWPKFQPGVIHYLPHDPDTDNDDIVLPDINDPVPDNWVTEQVAQESSFPPFSKAKISGTFLQCVRLQAVLARLQPVLLSRPEA